MRHCEYCDIEHTNLDCPRCGRRTPSRHAQRDEALPNTDTYVSDPSDSLDHMVETASRPSLSTLIKRGLDSGAIKPVHDYASARK
jgi:hypothetical protein